MKEDDIRPQDLKKGQEEAFQRDIDRLLKHKNKFVAVDCPACQAPHHRLVFSKQGVSYRECNDCGTRFVSPRPTPQMLINYHTQSEHYEYWQKYIFPATQETRIREIHEPRAKMVSEYAKEHNLTKSLMDIGAGDGSFCAEVNKLGIIEDVWAVEPSPLAATCQSRGIETINLGFEEIKAGGIGIITAFELIEHLFSPLDFIKKCHTMLRKGGLLILSTPNIDGFDIRLLQQESDQYNPEHINLFTGVSLKCSLMANGFDILSFTTPGKLDVDIVRNKMSGGWSGDWFATLSVWNWSGLQNFLVEHKSSSHMVMVAKKG